MSTRQALAAASLAAVAAITPLGAQGGWTEHALVLEVDGLRIPAVVAQPAGGRAASAILLIPGSLFSDADGNFPVWGWRPHAYADLARQLAARGHVVLRYAKAGPGTGTEVLDAERARAHQHFAERVAVARHALGVLRAEPAARGAPVYLAGHSEGAVVASLAAAEEPDVAGVVSLSGPSAGLLSIMREQLPDSADPAAFEAGAQAIRRGEPVPAEARQSPGMVALASMDPATLRYIREVDAVDPAAATGRVRAPMLLVQGGRDASVREHHVRALARTRGSLPTEIALFPELQHFYKRVDAGMDPAAAMQISTESDPAVAAAIDRWIRSERRRSRSHGAPPSSKKPG